MEANHSSGGGSHLTQKLQICDEIKSNMQAVVDGISASGWELTQGRFGRLRNVEDILNGWIGRFKTILPGDVITAIADVRDRLHEWKIANGAEDTPHQIINDAERSVSSILRAVRTLENNIHTARNSAENRSENLVGNADRIKRSLLNNKIIFFLFGFLF